MKKNIFKVLGSIKKLVMDHPIEFCIGIATGVGIGISYRKGYRNGQSDMLIDLLDKNDVLHF